MKIGLELDDLAGQMYTVAMNEARLGNHAFLTPEHFLYAVLMFDVGRSVVSHGGLVSVPSMVADLNRYLDGFGKLEKVSHFPLESPEFVEMIEYAIESAIHYGKDEIELSDLLSAMFYLTESFASRLMLKHGSEPGLVYAAYEDFKSGRTIGEEVIFPDMGHGFHTGQEEKPAVDFLARYATDMVEKARNGEYDELVGRRAVLDELVLLLSRRNKHNPVLVGDSGVGKTAIVEGLATRIVDKEVPTRLANSNIYHIDMGVMVAGTKFRGEFEERLIGTLEAAAEKKNAIVYLDDIHTMVGAGASSGGPLDAGSLIKPFLNRGDLRFIGTTTYDDYKKHFEKSASLTRRFQKIDIAEPTIGETIAILHGLADTFEAYHDVEYSYEALEAAAKLTAKYIHDARLPDKAIDAIDQAGASAANADLDRFVGIDEIEQAVATMAKIPETAISADERLSLATLKERLEATVFGQSDAIDALVSAITASRLGLNDPEKPVASLLFVGPTGVGKTEIARTLAEQMNMPLTRFDMSEYQEQHAVSRLIGSPAGYVGHEDGGALTDAIRKTPATVLLLDEIEKAHPSILNVLLQAMDYGKMTDSKGKQADFRNVVLIMTSNAGAREASRTTIGFDSKQDATAVKSTVNKTFSPEFRNRLTKIIQFNSITEDMASKIAVKAVRMLENRLASRGVSITPNQSALDFIAKRGFSAEYGVREIIRLVESTVKEQIAKALLASPAKAKTSLTITVEDDEIAII
ncbi:MAG: ATP-dependent Clp protease ATP-binding subunit [Defluviitaleaceae bacterium]|nr:ATP-dependent Clp protease ATP-binding subunit [Defluviitaleaceae bacterium]